MGSAEQIRHLKLAIRAVDVTVPRESWEAHNLVDGLPKGALIELVGPKKYEWFLAFLKAQPTLQIFWGEEKQQVLPTALAQRGVNLQNVTFGVLGNEAFLPLRKIIQSQVYQIVVFPNIFSDLKIFRAFQLLTEKANCSLVLFGKTPSTAWPISLQLEISDEIQILKKRFGGEL